jgi:4,4-dimethyl-9beta,19-cyclopropylsterol-4alpha-methyl oxidase
MLPYVTAAEAEAALGRAMTGAEAAWFSYSASMSDHLLYCHNVAILLVVYTLAPLPLALLDLLSAPRAVMSPLKLQPRAPRLSPAEFLRCYLDTARVLLLTVGMLSIVSFPVVQVRFIVHPCMYYCRSIILACFVRTSVCSPPCRESVT